MRIVTVTVTAVALSTIATMAFAQYPGEPAPPPPYDGLRDMNYNRAWGESNATVRDAQQVLHEQGFYDGPIDGIVRSPAYRRGLWKFQKAKGLPVTIHLDAATLQALGVPAPGAGRDSTAGSNFGATRLP